MAEENRRYSDKFALRLPEGLRERLAASAEENNRSTNAEIVARLEWSLEQSPTPVVPDTSAEIENLRIGLRAEENERNALEKRVKGLEQQLQELRVSDRSYDHEMRIARIEANIR